MGDREEERTKIVAGLGNPGRQYARTRHNVGFEVLEALRRRWNLGEGRSAFGGLLNDAPAPRGCSGVRRVLLIEPHTFMNRSGWSVIEVMNFYKAQPADVLVVLDDLALPLGQIRARTGGSAGGHKGLGDVMRALGTDQVQRLRVGIGPQPPRMDSVDFVLQTFSPAERDVMDNAYAVAAEAVEYWLARGMTFVMDKYNRKVQEEQKP